jgi:hypothetical protein
MLVIVCQPVKVMFDWFQVQRRYSINGMWVSLSQSGLYMHVAGWLSGDGSAQLRKFTKPNSRSWTKQNTKSRLFRGRFIFCKICKEKMICRRYLSTFKFNHNAKQGLNAIVKLFSQSSSYMLFVCHVSPYDFLKRFCLSCMLISMLLL